jgi:hypothetical protein
MPRFNPLPALITAASAAVIALAAAPHARADAALLDAYRTAFEAGDPAACRALFAPGARFMDLGNDFSERLDWFCQAVVDGNGRCIFTDVATDGDTTTFRFSFTAGSYAVSGTGSLAGTDGRIVELVIEQG